MAKATLSPVQFHGSTIFVVTHKGEPYAPIKPIVEDMGLTWEAQARKLRDNRDRWGMINMIIPSASGNQDTLCMPVRKLPAFFASINPNKVRPELRDRIRLYQDECDDALWNYWTKGQATRKPKAALPAPAQLNLPAAEPLFDEAPCSNWRKISAVPNRPTAVTISFSLVVSTNLVPLFLPSLNSGPHWGRERHPSRT